MSDEPQDRNAPPAEKVGLSLLADDLYGDTPPAAPPANPAAAPAKAAQDDDQPPAGDDDAPPAGDDDAPPAGDDDVEHVELGSIEELAQHFDLDPEWIRTLKVTDKVNGEPVTFSLADALATHRKVTAADSYLENAKTKAKSIVEQATHQQGELASTIATFGKLVTTAEAQLASEIKGVDWDKLRESDPGEYSAKREEVRQRQEQLQALKRDAQKSVEELAQKNVEAQQAALLERLPAEREAMLDLVPEWQDEEKAKVERVGVVKYLTDQGFTPQDIQFASFNGKLLAMVVKSMRYDASKVKKDEIRKKKVVRIPKVLKPGATKPTPTKPNGADKGDAASILYG